MTLLATLTAHHLRHDPADPTWPDRDRLVDRLGLAAATGMALAERTLAARFGRSLVDHRIWFSARPADLDAGAGQEAALAAGTLMLDRLAVLVTVQSSDKRSMLRFQAAGWNTRLVASGDARAAHAALEAAVRSRKPTLIAEYGEAGRAVNGDLEDADADAVRRSAGARRAWLKRLRRHTSREAFLHAQGNYLPPGWHKAVHLPDPASAPAHSTEAAARAALARLSATLPDLMTLSALDAARQPTVWDGLPQAAAGAALGAALHGGLLPVFWSDQGAPCGPDTQADCRDLGARWLRIIGGDPGGAYPDACFRPADGVETQDCLVLAMRQAEQPAILAVSPDPAPALPGTPRLCARGGYLVRTAPSPRTTLIAAGTDMAGALALADRLDAQGVATALVSLPSRILFDAQDESYRAMVLGVAPRVVFAASDPARFIGLAGPDDLVAGDGQRGAERLFTLLMRRLHQVPPPSTA